MSTVTIYCPNCAMQYEVGEDNRGKKLHCGVCGAKFAFERPAERTVFVRFGAEIMEFSFTALQELLHRGDAEARENMFSLDGSHFTNYRSIASQLIAMTVLEPPPHSEPATAEMPPPAPPAPPQMPQMPPRPEVILQPAPATVHNFQNPGPPPPAGGSTYRPPATPYPPPAGGNPYNNSAPSYPPPAGGSPYNNSAPSYPPPYPPYPAGNGREQVRPVLQFGQPSPRSGNSGVILGVVILLLVLLGIALAISSNEPALPDEKGGIFAPARILRGIRNAANSPENDDNPPPDTPSNPAAKPSAPAAVRNPQRPPAARTNAPTTEKALIAAIKSENVLAVRALLKAGAPALSQEVGFALSSCRNEEITNMVFMANLKQSKARMRRP